MHLFDRGRKGAIPTDAGVHLYSALKRSFAGDRHGDAVDHRSAFAGSNSSPCGIAESRISGYSPRLPEFMSASRSMSGSGYPGCGGFGNNGLDIAIVLMGSGLTNLLCRTRDRAADADRELCVVMVPGARGGKVCSLGYVAGVPDSLRDAAGFW